MATYERSFLVALKPRRSLADFDVTVLNSAGKLKLLSTFGLKTRILIYSLLVLSMENLLSQI